MKVRPTSARPLNKVLAGTLGSALGVIAAWVLRTYVVQDLPPEVELAMTTILTALVSLASAYFTPIADGEVERAP